MFALASGEPVPVVSTGQMRELDRSMAGYFGIDLARMMENAGRNLADLGQLLFAPRTVIVLAGPGGNGGGGLAAARHLHNRGITVSVVLAGGPLAPVTAQQASIVTRMGILIRDDPAPAELILDALLGYGCTGTPRGGSRS
jgi:NAD(P)H-hydrate epimerase